MQYTQTESIPCYHCDELFQHHNPLMIIVVLKDRLFWNENDYLHLKCFREIAYKYGNIVDKIIYPDTTQNLKGFRDLSLHYKKQVKEIIFPHLVDKSIKYQLALSMNNFNIKTLDSPQLILEMKKRNLPIFEQTNSNYEPLKISYYQLFERFQTFLDDYKCQAKHTELVFGFCRRITTKNKIPFIVYLIRIILKYGPLYICE